MAIREKEAAEALTRVASREEEVNKLSADHQSRIASKLEPAQKAREEVTQRLAAIMESARVVFDQARALRPQMEMVQKNSEEAFQVTRDISTCAGLVASRLSDCES